MTPVNRCRRPTFEQATWLRRIAQSQMVKTYVGGEPHYLLQNGAPIPAPLARSLINHGWVKGVKDGLFDDPQTYIALKP